MGFFNKLLSKAPRKEKLPEDKFTEPFLCKFSPKQIKFIEEMAEVESTSKAVIVRKSINIYINNIRSNQK